MPRPASYKTLTNVKKLEILKESSDTGKIKPVAAKYGVSPKSIRDWQKIEDKLRAEVGNGRADRRHCSFQKGLHHYPEMEIVLAAWVEDARRQGLLITRKMICAKALDLLDHLMIPHATFKASTGWLSKFMRRHQLTSRAVSSLNQHDPVDINMKVTRFILFMRMMLEENIGNKVWAADETPVFYDLISSRTVEKKGRQEVKVRSSGGEKKMVTCIPVASNDGDKKPITIIFRGKGKAKEDKEVLARTDCIVLFSDNGWLQDDTAQQFLRKNFTPHEKELLVWDSYKCHYQGNTPATLKDLNMVNLIIPGGCTRVIQTCDVVWNSPLKQHLRDSWNEWMNNGLKTYTKNGKMRTMSKMQLCDSIVSAWGKITPDMIRKSFEICGQIIGFNPDSLSCMKEGKSCEAALPRLKELLAFPTHQLDLQMLAPLPEGVVQMEYNMDIEEEEDPLL